MVAQDEPLMASLVHAGVLHHTVSNARWASALPRNWRRRR